MDFTEIIVKLRKIIRSINLESKRIEKSLGISIPQLLCLQYLAEQKEYKSTATQIKAYLNLNASTTSGIIKRLEAKGLLARLPNPSDKRGSFIALTAMGLELIRSSPTTLQEKITQRLKQLPEDQVQDLVKNIDLLVDIMNAGELDASPMITSGEISAERLEEN